MKSRRLVELGGEVEGDALGVLAADEAEVVLGDAR
jgi:hypothetical protein